MGTSKNPFERKRTACTNCFVKSPHLAWSPRQRGGVELARQRVSPPLGEVAKPERDDRQKTDRPAIFRSLSLHLAPEQDALTMPPKERKDALLKAA